MQANLFNNLNKSSQPVPAVAAKTKKSNRVGTRITDRHRKALDAIFMKKGANESLVICDLLDALADSIERSGLPERPYRLSSSNLYELENKSDLLAAEPAEGNKATTEVIAEIKRLAEAAIRAVHIQAPTPPKPKPIDPP